MRGAVAWDPAAQRLQIARLHLGTGFTLDLEITEAVVVIMIGNGNSYCKNASSIANYE